ncbi:DUF2214 domain-containing protein [Roseomonas populi]|uniref:DUF2214 domain-containing protein n=1 Tax=Roseomonas populi TaxID=3121582 RepID=A0ABT1XCG6_9PROT|nr:DUF2214 domain-containing protein [Roseomonas pecuniae]MCR0984679.1 DUF2214 domain-containing protein [Roseomonas pecuniae]
MDPLAALSDWSVAAALRRSAVLYPLVNAAHILGIGLLIGAITALDLRVLGAFRAAPLAVFGPPLVRVAGAGVALAVGTGFLLFSVRPAEYAANPAFLLKLGLVGLGLVNVLALRLGSGWRQALAGGPVGAAVRGGAVLSLLLWVGAVLAGRWIAFVG